MAAFRDATLLKTVYAFGLRRREAAMLDVHDFTPNPKAPQFGMFGVCGVRYGKAVKGSAPRRRSVLATMAWACDGLGEYLERVRPSYAPGPMPALWPTERGGRVSSSHVSRRFIEYRRGAGLPEELHLHCLRHSYITHLIEDGFDPLFVQQQVGHAWASTTALYASAATTRTRPWSGPWPAWPVVHRRASRTITQEAPREQTHRRLPLEPAAVDGRSWSVRHHRPGPAADRTRHQSVVGPGLPPRGPTT